MTTITRMRWGLSLLCFVLGLFALSQIPAEHQSSMMTRRNADQVIALVSDPDHNVPISASWRTQYDQVAVCIEAMNSILAQFLPSASQAKLAAGCERVAGAVLQGAPTFALAHLSNFLTAERQGGDAIGEMALAADLARVEPSEQRLRLRFVAEHAPDFGPELAAIFAQDAALMVQSDWGRRWMAKIYIDLPAARDALTSAVETGDARAQQSFLWAVQSEQKARAAALAEAQASEEAAP